VGLPHTGGSQVEVYLEALFLMACTLLIIIAGLLVSFKRYWFMPTSPPSARKMLKEKQKQASEPLRVDDEPIKLARTKAEDRAAALLWSKLNNGQKNTYSRIGEFIVFTHRGMFRIGMSGRVTYSTPSGNWRSFCINLILDYDLPPSDKIISFKVAAEADPSRFLLTGNVGS
jgi:hypothetical protein